ncbi:light-regulated signal transduction histidine kinase (bacteriophytochrome) [Rhizobium pisi]
MQDARRLAISAGISIAAVGLALIIFIADTLASREIVFSVFYVVIVLLASRFYRPRSIILVAVGCVALTIISYAISESHEAAIGAGAVNTAISIGTITLTTVLVVIDRTREVLRQELAKRAAELEALNKELESFAYSVSHDLRAPIRHIVGYAELLQKQASSSLDEKCQRYVRMIQDASKRMGNLIDDLLGFSRIGRAEARKTVVSLKQLVNEVVAELGPETSGRDITWKIGSLPSCYGDRSMLKLVVSNLIANAVKFTRMRARAEIEIDCTINNKNDVEVFVRDNGAGFDMRYVDKLFGVFQRLHTSEEFEGTGIGLATVQRIIHRHGGDVRAEGAVDHGATFTFSVPGLSESRYDREGK